MAARGWVYSWPLASSTIGLWLTPSPRTKRPPEIDASVRLPLAAAMASRAQMEAMELPTTSEEVASRSSDELSSDSLP